MRRFEGLIGVPHSVVKKVPILIGGAGLRLLFGLPRPVALEEVPGPGRQAHGAAALLRFGAAQDDALAVLGSRERVTHAHHLINL